MSGKERKRMFVLTQVGRGEMSLAQGARLLGICYRQAKRIWQRFKSKGDAGLIHRARGKPSSRRKSAKLRKKALDLYRTRYPDFGPTLAAEKLQAEGVQVDHETLRRWLLEKGLWTVGRKRKQHRSWRERRECFGQMVQLDGSHHDWFEGRRDKAVLMVMVDDATNHTVARFFEEETTEASYGVFEAWVRKHGLPCSLYVDRDSIYRCERMLTIEEQIAGVEPQTQFGRVMGELAVELILAHSPQAKGRVERRNGLLQDRLVKELRLAGINDLELANEFLARKFLPELNRKFTVQARNRADAHRPNKWNLKEALNWEEERVVGNDWTVAWNRRWFQISREEAARGLPGQKVIVRRLRSGALHLIHKGRTLRWKELPERPERPKAEPRRVGRIRLQKPQQQHPWRKAGGAAGKKFWRNVKAEGARERRAARQAAAASAQPPLRSGLSPAAAA